MWASTHVFGIKFGDLDTCRCYHPVLASSQIHFSFDRSFVRLVGTQVHRPQYPQISFKRILVWVACVHVQKKQFCLKGPTRIWPIKYFQCWIRHYFQTAYTSHFSLFIFISEMIGWIWYNSSSSWFSEITIAKNAKRYQANLDNVKNK